MRHYGDEDKKHGNENTEEMSSRRNQNGLDWKGPYRSSSSHSPAMGTKSFVYLMKKDEINFIIVVIY